MTQNIQKSDPKNTFFSCFSLYSLPWTEIFYPINKKLYQLSYKIKKCTCVYKFKVQKMLNLIFIHVFQQFFCFKPEIIQKKMKNCKLFCIILLILLILLGHMLLPKLGYQFEKDEEKQLKTRNKCIFLFSIQIFCRFLSSFCKFLFLFQVFSWFVQVFS